MTSRRLDARAMIACAAALMIWATAWIAVQLSAGVAPPGRSTIAIAAAFDFVVTAGIAVYLIAVRAGRLPRWALGVTIALGLVFARLVLSSVPSATYAVPAVLIAIELAMLTMAVIRGRHARARYRVARAAGASALDALTEALIAARFPARLASVVATELVLMSLIVTGWRRPGASASRFTVHRTGGWPLYAGVLIFLVLVETVAVHILVAAYASVIVAWVLTATSIYSALWLVGDVLALRHSGVEVGARDLELGIGVRWRGRVPWSAITSIERVTEAPADAVDISVLGANVVVRLATPHVLHGLFGRRREAMAIALSIDEPEAFVGAVTAATLRA